jgi:hypothetical protein
MPITSDELLSIEDLRKPTKLHVKAWKRDVYILDPTAEMLRDWEAYCSLPADRRGDIRARLVVKLVCDEDGNRVFRDDQIVAVGKKSAAAIKEISEFCAERMRITDKDIEEYEKN